MVTPSKVDEDAELASKHITVGRWVSYDDGRTSRQGKVTQILKTPEETAHPPIVVYECENKKGEMKEYKNKPSRLEIYHHK